MSVGKDNFRYYMPLTKGSPQDGPTTSVFSVPRVQYSPETTATVKNLMRESRLTFTQKHVFDTILRDGKSLTTHAGQMRGRSRQSNMMQNRHRHKARQMGIPLLEEDFNPAQYRLASNMLMAPAYPGRRSLDSIMASGDLEPPPLPKFYRPVNKDAEKDRLAHKMAYGKDVTNSPFPFQQCPVENKPESKTRKKKSEADTIAELNEQRIEELIDEIQDRMQFLLTMDEAKKAKNYKDCIMSQINEKLHEMKRISPEKEKDVRECLQLELFDKRMGPMQINDHRSSKVLALH